MEKEYDLKALGAELKGQGLEIAEESLKSVVVALFNWLEKSADLSPNPYDDMAKIVYPKIKAEILKLADNINKEDNA